MTTFATDQDLDPRVVALDGRERDAWERYREELRPLGSDAYAIAEPAAWDALQITLDEVRAERAALVAPPARAH